jgi:excinuclease ABC subunit C
MSAETNDKFETIREKIKHFPNGPGLYFMKGSKDKVLYIGKANNLRSRAASYFQQAADLTVSRGPKITEMLGKVKTVDFLETSNEVETTLAEARLIKDIRPPYNTDLVDDKTFPYLEITAGQDFPGVYITRKPYPQGSRLFGPFAGAKDLRGVLVILQKIFKFRTCRLDIKKDDQKRRFFRPCILYSIKQCTAPCAAKIEKAEYKKIISDLVKFLKSKRSTILRQLKKQMAEAADALAYEKAAMFRDRIRLIERLDRRGTPDEDVQPEVFAADPTEALEKLQNLLKSPEPVRIIEGIDVANIAGTEAVGSLVKFIDGRPFKSGYRRFRIKTVKGIDDYAMIAEVVKRRYKYALRGEELWPDLVLIDGGLGHLHAAEAALRELYATEGKEILSHREHRGHREFTKNLRVAAIAKREEEIYLQGSLLPLKLPRHSPVLKLLQYVRDEAHRFAQHYFHILRSKKLIGENK